MYILGYITVPISSPNRKYYGSTVAIVRYHDGSTVAIIRYHDGSTVAIARYRHGSTVAILQYHKGAPECSEAARLGSIHHAMRRVKTGLGGQMKVQR